MKGIFFENALELVLDVAGESWKQGDVVRGTLQVINRGSKNFPLDKYGVKLCFGPRKKVKSNDLDLLKEENFLGSNEIKKGETKELPFNFSLSNNSPISEKTSGIFLFCGDNNFLDLNITPHKIISSFFEFLEVFLRFKIKGLKNKKDQIEATLAIPANKDYTGIEDLKILVKLKGENLDLVFQFKLKKITFEGGGIKTEDKKQEIKKSLTPKDYLIYGDNFNQDKVLSILKEILEEVKLKPMI